MRATDCQRTLAVRATSVDGGIAGRVLGYDDAGDGVPVQGARVSAGGVTAVSGSDGRAELALAPGSYRVVARKASLVRSFAERVTVP
jgi:hypothetical protein